MKENFRIDDRGSLELCNEADVRFFVEFPGDTRKIQKMGQLLTKSKF